MALVLHRSWDPPAAGDFFPDGGTQGAAPKGLEGNVENFDFPYASKGDLGRHSVLNDHGKGKYIYIDIDT